MKRLLFVASVVCLGCFSQAAEYYVNPKTGSDANRGDSWKPLQTIEMAISKLGAEGGTVYLSDGTYDLTGPVVTGDCLPAQSNSNFVVTAPIVFEGLSKNPAKVIVKRYSGGYYRPFYLNNAGAALRYITVSNGNTGGTSEGGGVYIDSEGATVENCIISGNAENGGSGEYGGGGIFMKAGLVKKCIVENNRDVNMRRYGSGIFALGGRIEQCIIRGNTSPHHGSSCNGNAAVLLKGTAIMLNSVVTGNKSCLVSGIWVDDLDSCAAINCISYGNTFCTQTHTAGATHETGLFCARSGQVTLTPKNQVKANKFISCAAENGGVFSAVGALTLTGSPFADLANGDYRIAEDSALIDKGTSKDGEGNAWFSAGETDYYGAARVSGVSVDIGLHEIAREGLVIGSLTASATSAKIPEEPEVTFSVETAGGVGELSYAWDFGDGDPVTTNVATIVHEYTTSGTYTVKVTVSDGSSSVEKTYDAPIKVSGVKCSFDVACNKGKPGDVLEITTEVEVGNDLTFTWNFGDGSTPLVTKELTVTHAYDSSGEYTVTVNAYGIDDGERDYTLETKMRIVGFDIYVNKTGSAVFPYATAATGAKDPQVALDVAVDGCTVHVRPGTYTTKNYTVNVTNDVTVVGEGATPNDVVFHNAYGNFQNGWRNMIVNSPNAKVANLTLYGGFGNCAVGGNLVLNDGVVSNCVLSTGGSNSSGGGAGAAYVESGLLTHCVITNSYLGNRGNGIAVWQKGGRVSNCLITENARNWLSSRNNFALYYAEGGVVDNCSIVNCHILKYSKALTTFWGRDSMYRNDLGFYVGPNAKAYNVVVAGLKYDAYSEEAGAIVMTDEIPQNWAGTRENFVKCVTEDTAKINDTCYVGTASSFFADYAAGNYDPASPLRNKGTAVPGCDFPSVDLGGKPREVGRAIDIGCYELPPGNPLLIIFR